MPIPVVMDVLALLDDIGENEGTTTAPPKIGAGKKIQKRPGVEGSIQDSNGSEGPQLTWCRIRKVTAPLRANTSLVLAFLLFLPY